MDFCGKTFILANIYWKYFNCVMQYEIKQVDKFRFIEEGEGEPLVLLHGLIWRTQQFRGPDRVFQKAL